MSKKYVVVGGGVAGTSAAEKLREEDGDCEITVLTDEKEPLYSRIMLKNYMKGMLPRQYTRVHGEDWYEKNDIDLRLETRVEEVRTGEKKVVTADGDELEYDSVLVATGGDPREFPADEGFDNLYYMWTMEMADEIKEAAEEAEKAVVIGGGLLGIDLAVAFGEHDVETHYMIREGNWWHRGLDPEGAEIIHRHLEDLGVNVMTETSVTEFESEGGEVVAAVTDEGERYECDAVGVAIGQVPNSDVVDVEKNDHGMIMTDEYLETSADDVYAAGNMVEYESPVFERRVVNGSWDHSEEMGVCAAENMSGGEEEFDYVNTYGVGHFNVQFLAIGDWTGEPISRKYGEDEYRRLFVRDGRLVGAVMIGYTEGQEELKKIIRDKEELDEPEKLLDKDHWS
ncbi:MAG: NAD(P)/FAD-dependent oxidoreductase [Candidatus Nanohaloarchaea archaeon]